MIVSGFFVCLSVIVKDACQEILRYKILCFGFIVLKLEELTVVKKNKLLNCGKGVGLQVNLNIE